MRCAVFGCNCDNKSKKNPISGVKFFHFSKNKDLAKKWLHATGRKDKHKLLNYTPARYRGLKEDAIPNKNLPLARAVNSCPELGCFSRSSAEAPSHRDKRREDRERKQLIQELLNVNDEDNNVTSNPDPTLSCLTLPGPSSFCPEISKENDPHIDTNKW
ncbi:hypothetical protein ABEB36_014141 [Hypothenemus hampei]|uniref:THAP-type domain-containing protein n=1 Tax=Hypothenemus hampei TaxID=57062 RepID=A0ABD1E3N2_HYPHA